MLLPIGDYVLRLCPSSEERTELARVARGRARQGRRAGGSAANVPDRNANQRQDRGSERRTFPRFGTSTWCRGRSEEHTSEIQSLMRTSYAVCCLNTVHKEPTRT